MIKRYLFLLMLWPAIFLYGHEKSFADEVAMRRMTDEVAQLFLKNEIGQAFETMKTYWPMPEVELSSLETQTVKLMTLLKARIGDPVDYVFLREKRLKDVAVQYVYLLRYEKHALRLRFYFYNNGQYWMLNTFKWDDMFTNEFDRCETGG